MEKEPREEWRTGELTVDEQYRKLGITADVRDTDVYASEMLEHEPNPE